jgi:GT2 family glycosyltransferase
MTQTINFNGSPTPSVIICAFTEARWDELVRAVHAVEAQQPAPMEVVLVIDHNPSLLARARHAFPRVQLLENQEARGLSGARNTGVKAAKGDVLIFMDEDAFPEPGWLARLLEGYADPQVLGVGGAILPEWVGARPAWFPDEFLWVVGCTYLGMPEKPSPVRNLIGANMSFRRDAFFDLGGFNRLLGRLGSLPIGGEETEFSIRLRQHKPHGILLYDPRARVQHSVPPARAAWSYFRSRCYQEGLSKALVAQLVGSKDGLGSERAYTVKVLPRGVLRGLGQALRGDFSGLLRAAAITAGLGLTAEGYLLGKLRLRRAAKKRSTGDGLRSESSPERAPGAEQPVPQTGGEGHPFRGE